MRGGAGSVYDAVLEPGRDGTEKMFASAPVPGCDTDVPVGGA